jgi:hypothetical protein
VGREEVRVCDVADVGEVEEVLVGAELEIGLGGQGNFGHAGEGLGVAFAEDACGADGAGEEFRESWGAVCG